MNKYKIIIFDLDDTLIDNFENVKYAFKVMIEEMKEKYQEDNFLRWYEIDKKFWHDWQDGLIEVPNNLKIEQGKKSKEFLDWVRAQRVLIYYNNEISLETAIKLNNIFMKALSEKVIAIDGAYETLEYLASKYTIVVATNGPKIAVKDKVDKIDCSKFINEILSAEMFGYMKPHEEYFKGIQNTLNNFNNEEYLIVGDSLKSDVGFAMNCHFDSCWFNKNNIELDEKYKPTMIIKSLNELIKLL